jgi:hypothetical protein
VTAFTVRVKAAQCLQLLQFTMSWFPRIVFDCLAINTRLLLAIFSEGVLAV